MKYRMSVALIAMALLLSGEADHWPQFRGPAGTGIAESPVPVEFGPKQNLLWTATVPLGHSSPSIWGAQLFLTSFDNRSKKLEVLAYDRQNGRIRWRQAVPAKGIEKVHEVNNPATATPVVDGERVYVYFGSAGLFCYDLEGKPVWSNPMPVADVDYGSGTSPVLAEDALILARDDGEPHMLVHRPVSSL